MAFYHVTQWRTDPTPASPSKPALPILEVPADLKAKENPAALEPKPDRNSASTAATAIPDVIRGADESNSFHDQMPPPKLGGPASAVNELMEPKEGQHPKKPGIKVEQIVQFLAGCFVASWVGAAASLLVGGWNNPNIAIFMSILAIAGFAAFKGIRHSM